MGERGWTASSTCNTRRVCDDIAVLRSVGPNDHCANMRQLQAVLQQRLTCTTCRGRVFDVGHQHVFNVSTQRLQSAWTRTLD